MIISGKKRLHSSSNSATERKIMVLEEIPALIMKNERKVIKDKAENQPDKEAPKVIEKNNLSPPIIKDIHKDICN